MSNGKKWKMTSKQIHKIHRHCQRYSYWRVGGGKNGNPGFKYFRNKKKFKKLIDETEHLSMSKMTAIEIWYWD